MLLETSDGDYLFIRSDADTTQVCEEVRDIRPHLARELQVA